MTSPSINVGAVSVTIEASAKGFAKSLRQAILAEFKSANVDKLIADALGKFKFKVPLTPDTDGLGDKLPEKIPTKRPPKVPTELDPLIKEFQAQMRREAAKLAKQVSVGVPVTPETADLRSRLAAEIQQIERQTRVKVPTEPAERREYEQKLRALVDAVSRSVSAKIPVQPDATQAAAAGRRASAVAQAAAPAVSLKVDVDVASTRRVATALAGLARAASTVSIGVGGIGAVAGGGAAALAGLASAAAGAIPVIASIAATVATASGAFLALPGAIAVAAAGIGALKVAFGGIGEALKQTAKVSGGAGGAVAGAEKRIAAAQREVLRSQEALNQARKIAKERIEDLGRSLRGARLDEEEAALALRDAERDLAEARARGNTDEIERADLAYRQAALGVELARDRTEDLAEEQQDAAKKGVEGSDEVRAAIERQVAAVEALSAAQTSLGGGGGLNAAAAAMAKLSPAGRELVNTINAIRPAWQAMQRAVQQAALVMVGKDIRTFSDSILPTMRTGLVGIAEILNTQIRAGLAELSTANTRIQLATIFTNAKTALGNLTDAVRPLLDALLRVAAVGSGVVSDLTAGLGDTIKRISERLSELAESGQLKAIIEDGLRTLAAFGSAAADVFGIIRGIFAAAGTAPGGGIFGFFDRLNTLVNSVAGQDALGKLFGELARIGDALTPVLLAVGQALGPVAQGIADIAVAFAPVLVSLVGELGAALASLAPAFVALAPAVSAIAGGLRPLADILVGLVVGAAPGITAFLNGLVAGLVALAPAAKPVGEALGAILTAVAPLLQALGAGLAVVFTALAGHLQVMAVELGPVIGLFAEFAVTALQMLLPVIQELVTNGLPLAIELGIAFAQALAPLIPVLIDIARVMIGQLLTVLPQIQQAIAPLIPVFAQLAGQIGKALLEALLAIAPSIPALTQAALQLALAAAELFVTMAPLIPPLIELALLFLKFMTGPGNLDILIGLLTIVTLNLKLLTGVVNSILGPFLGAQKAVSSFGEAVKTKFGDVVNLVKGLPGRIISAIGSLGSTLYNAGRDLVTGLWNGIKSMGDWLRDTLISWAKDKIPGPIRKALGIESPSKLMAREVGRWIPAGIAEGITGGLPALTRTAQDVADSVIDDMERQFQFTPAAALAASWNAEGLQPASQFIEIPIHIGDEVVRVVRHEVSERDRRTRSRVLAGAGALR